MSDNFFQTFIELETKSIHFEEYYIKRPEGKIKNIIYKGNDKAKPSQAFLDALDNSDWVILPPSNPFVSIGTILSLKKVRNILKEKNVIGISPLIRGKAIKGPLVQMMKYSDFEVNSYGIAKYYQDILDIFILDSLESDLENKIKNELGIEVFNTNTLMKTKKDRINLSKFVLKRMET